MKGERRILPLTLAVIMLLIPVMLAACAGGRVGDTTTAGGSPAGQQEDPGSLDVSTDPAETEPSFRFFDRGGANFTVYQRSQTENDYPGKYIVPSEDSSDVISEAAVRRNLMVQEAFNTVICAIEVQNPYKTVIQDINSGSDDLYDIILDRRRYVAPLCIDGALVNLNRYETDFTTHWWDAKAAYTYSAAGKLFVMPNDVSIANLGGARFFYFNKAVLEDFHLTSPYEYEEKNEWTLETFTNMVKSVSAPNSDGTLGVFGLVNEDTSIRNHCLVGCGIEWLTKVDENTFEVRLGTEYRERTQDYLDRITALINDSSCVLEMGVASSMDPEGATAWAHKYDHSRALFAQDHFLFTHSSMNCAHQFADMVKGFGVIMNPKYDSNQAEYYHKIDSNTLIFTIPKFSGTDPQQTLDIMDYWGYVASSTSMEAFYELTLKTKRASDPTAARMLDIVKGSIAYPISDLFTSEPYKIDVGSIINTAVTRGVANAWDTYRRSTENSIKKVITKLGEISD
jgi:hypothetical protein